MPEVIQVRPKGIYITFEMSLEEVTKLRDGLSRAKLFFSGSVPEEVEAARYVTEDFCPFLNKLVGDLKHGA